MLTFPREPQNHCVNTLFRPWAIFAQLVKCDLFQGTKVGLRSFNACCNNLECG